MAGMATADAVFRLNGESEDQLVALAAAVGSQQPDKNSQQTEIQEENDACQEREKSREEQEPLLAKLALVTHYSSICVNRGIQRHFVHETALSNVPESLFPVLRRGSCPAAKAGGAIVTAAVPPGTQGPLPQQTEAFVVALSTISNVPRRILLLDHLDLSGTPVPATVLPTLVRHAAALGPWWRLRSLCLRSCHLSAQDLEVLASQQAAPLVWHLQRLDLSANPKLGTNNDGTVRSAKEYATPDVLLLLNFWKNAPLRHLDLTGTGFSGEALIACLRMLRSYALPSTTNGCGMPMHDGTRPCIESLRLGPLHEETWEHDALTEVQLLIEACPNLVDLEVHGPLPQDAAMSLHKIWEETLRKRGIQPAETNRLSDETVLRLGANIGPSGCAGLLIEAPNEHTLPAPDTPHKNASGEPENKRDEPIVLDDWLLQAPSAENDKELVSDVTNILRCHQSGGNPLPPRQPGHERRHAGEHHGMRPQQRGPKRAASSKKRRRHAAANGTGTGDRSPRMYRGGRVEDELPAGDIDLDAGQDEEGVLLHDSDFDDEDEDGYMHDGVNLTGGGDEELEWSDGIDFEEEAEEAVRGSSQRRRNDVREGNGAEDHSRYSDVATQSAVRTADEFSQPEPFRLRDGALDIDSQLGRKYRAMAKRLAERIPSSPDRKIAKKAFRLWDQFAANAWDRHRWDRPSRTQNDKDVLGQLNLLYDLLEKHEMLVQLEFPFPQRVRGGGAMAFDHTKDPPQPQQRHAPLSRAIHSTPEGEGVTATEIRRNAGNRARASAASGRHHQDRMLPTVVISSSTSEEDNEEEAEAHGTARWRHKGPRRTLIEDYDEDDDFGVERARHLQSEDDAPIGCEAGAQERNVAEAEDSRVRTTARTNGLASTRHIASSEHLKQRRCDIAEARRQRELARLDAWGWDSRREEHPPSEEYYGPAVGKRPRKARLPASDLAAMMGNEDQRVFLEEMGLEAAPETQHKFRTIRTEAPDTSSSDDDLPLGLLVAPRMPPIAAVSTPQQPTTDTSEMMPHRSLEVEGQCPEERFDGDVVLVNQEQPLPNLQPVSCSDPTSLQHAGLSSAERAATAARAMLGRLYMVPAPQMHQGYVPRNVGEMQAGNDEEGKVLPAIAPQDIIPDSQEDAL